MQPEPFLAEDFIQWGDKEGVSDESEPIELDDPVAQSDLIRAMVFGIPPKAHPAE